MQVLEVICSPRSSITSSGDRGGDEPTKAGWRLDTTWPSLPASPFQAVPPIRGWEGRLHNLICGGTRNQFMDSFFVFFCCIFIGFLYGIYSCVTLRSSNLDICLCGSLLAPRLNVNFVSLESIQSLTPWNTRQSYNLKEPIQSPPGALIPHAPIPRARLL